MPRRLDRLRMVTQRQLLLLCAAAAAAPRNLLAIGTAPVEINVDWAGTPLRESTPTAATVEGARPSLWVTSLRDWAVVLSPGV
eukprot:SAG22_NODE_7651_length_720_cov_1.653784_1_plen_83_part_00